MVTRHSTTVERTGRTARARRRRRVVLGVVLGLVALLVVFRLALPGLIEAWVNRTLDRNPQYDGSIGGVHLNLLRGAYSIDRVTLIDTSARESEPLFSADRVDLGIRWDALLHGALVGQVAVATPRIRVEVPAAQAAPQKPSVDWQETVRGLFPFRIDRVAVTDGFVRVVDREVQPPIELTLSDIRGEADNLTNSAKISDSMVATVSGTGRPMGMGQARLDARVAPLTELPTFDANLKVTGLDLPKLNDLIRRYGKFDVEAGTMDVFAEIAAKEGRFDGYVKPVLHDVKVFQLEHEIEQHESPVRIAWEGVVGAVKGVLNNDRHDQLATQIPISGRLDDPNVGVWSAIGSALSNAFVQALSNGLNNEINWASVPGRVPR